MGLREKEIGGSAGSPDPRRRVLAHPHTIGMESSECTFRPSCTPRLRGPPPPRYTSLAEVLAALHRVDVVAVGLERFGEFYRTHRVLS